MTDIHTLKTDLVVGESARWHDGRLWLANWGAGEILAISSDGAHEVIVEGLEGFPISFDWLPDGRLIIVEGRQARVVVREADGSLAPYADLSGLASGWNEIVVDGRGNVYVNGSDFKFLESAEFVPGIIALVTPDGTIRQVAEDIAFANGMVVTADDSTLVVAESFGGRLTAFDIAADGSLGNRRVWAEVGGDGICLDAEGAIWTPIFSDDGKTACIRIADGGTVLDRVELEMFCFSCTLGGDDGKTLFMLVADWQGPENAQALFTSRTGRVLTTTAPVAGARRVHR